MTIFETKNSTFYKEYIRARFQKDTEVTKNENVTEGKNNKEEPTMINN
ncbi:MAG: hypothetical protein ACOC31_02000 [Bacteroidota bacterium]